MKKDKKKKLKRLRIILANDIGHETQIVKLRDNKHFKSVFSIEFSIIQTK